MSRDWVETLWPCSFKGAAFYVEEASLQAGKRVVTHEFPYSDQNFNDELGKAARRYDVRAYLVGDSCDAQADALVAAVESAGAGVLVLPDTGPVNVQGLTARRQFAKQKLGFVAVDCKFVIDYGAGALSSALSLASSVFDGVASVGEAAAAALGQAPAIGAPQWVAHQASAGLRDIAAGLETVLSGSGIAAALAEPILTQLQNAYALIPSVVDNVQGAAPLIVAPAPPGAPASWGDPSVITSTPLAQIVASLAAAPAQPAPAPVATPSASPSVGWPYPDGGADLIVSPSPSSTEPVAAAFLAAIDLFPAPAAPVIASGNSVLAWQAGDAAARCGRALMLAGYAGALALVKWQDRQAAAQARTQALAAFDAALADAADNAPATALYRTISDLEDKLLAALSAAMLNLQPLVMVSAGFEAPALYWAWRLYTDPTRAQELVDRNRLGHPAFTPDRFEALAA
jgi:prophage DNA circulation protein